MGWVRLVGFGIVLSIFYIVSDYVYLTQNVMCKSFSDYHFPEGNENCHEDPDLALETPEIIRKYAGNVQVHTTTTQDGYILTLFRIPRIASKKIILLHHSIGVDSRIYLWQGNDSLAITLWRHGYDVWLANHRGTFYSSKHVNLSTHDFQYWDFYSHEMGLYDVTSELDLIKGHCGQSKVIYMGHSLGSAMGLIYASLKPQEAEDNLSSLVLLSAPTYFEYISGLANFLRHVIPVYVQLMHYLKIGSALSVLPFFKPVLRILLRLFPSLIVGVVVLSYALWGYTPQQTDPTFFNYELGSYLDNLSWKTLNHFFLMANSGRLYQMYDHGTDGNLRVYGNETPPRYPLEDISVPTLMVSSLEDILTPFQDNQILFEQLSPQAKTHGHWKIFGLNHFDYVAGIHRKDILVDNLLRFMKCL